MLRTDLGLKTKFRKCGNFLFSKIWILLNALQRYSEFEIGTFYFSFLYNFWNLVSGPNLLFAYKGPLSLVPSIYSQNFHLTNVYHPFRCIPLLCRFSIINSSFLRVYNLQNLKFFLNSCNSSSNKVKTIQNFC